MSNNKVAITPIHQRGSVERMAGSSTPRLKDVASAANVSLSAASRILRGERDRFGDDTCRRVLEVARQLGWRRNLLVNGIQTGRTKTIGVMIPPFDSFWVDVLSGIHQTLAAADYLPITVWIGDCREIPPVVQDDNQGLRQISRLLDRRVDGLILWPTFAVAYYDHYRELVERRVPVAVIDQGQSADQIADSVETDEEAAAQVVLEHLVSLGHKNIGVISARETEWETWAVRRRESFEHVARQHGGLKVNSWKLNAEWTNGPEIAREILTQPNRPSAIYCLTDHEALYVYQEAKQLGLRIPDDVSVIGFADLDFSASLEPGLTTMRQRPKEIGQRTAQLVLDRLSGELADTPVTTIRVGADLIRRGSTAKASA